MLVLKIALGVFVGALGALLAYDALSVYRVQRVAAPMSPASLKGEVLGARFDREVHSPQAADKVRALAAASPASAGSIEWTGKPDTRVTVPR